MKHFWQPSKLIAVSLIYFVFAANSSCNEEHKPTTETCFEVAYLPSQCAEEHSGVIGLLNQEGKYLMVQGSENPLEKFKSGDRVKAVVVVQENCMVCEACICPRPDACVTVSSIQACE